VAGTLKTTFRISQTDDDFHAADRFSSLTAALYR
jgi:hypothetical protein